MSSDTETLRALVTNDDGILSEGLHLLAAAARSCGLTTRVVAPCWDSSGSSASLTAVSEEGRVLVEALDPRSLPASADQAVVGVHGAPAFIVRAAIYGAFGPPPDVVLSGINKGPNTGRAIIHSGTVGAAVTASNHGRRALAISADLADPPDWATAAEVAHSAVRWLLKSREPTVLNVNVPVEVHGTSATRLATVGTVQANVTEVHSGFIPVSFTDVERGMEPGSDAAALADGYVSVTALKSVCEDDGQNLDELLRS